MRGRRKNSSWKLFVAALVVAGAAALLYLPSRMPRPKAVGKPGLVPVGRFAGRKNIYDCRLHELAVSLRLTSVYARPLELRDPDMIARELAPILGRNEKELLSTLKSERSFVWLARRLDAATAKRIAALKVKGLYFFDEEKRYYPHHETAAHVLGFLSNDQGLAGIEFYYGQILQGGWGRDQKLPANLQAALGQTGEKGEGASLILTLDLGLQTRLERELARARKKTRAAAAMALVMEPASGEVLALVSLPTFDPNRFWKYTSADRRNRVLADAVYPGGLWGLFREAAAAQELSESAAGQNAGKAPFLAPRHQKRAVAGAAAAFNPDWAKFEEGIDVSAALAGLSSLLPNKGELSRLLRHLEITGKTGIDLPMPPGGLAPALKGAPDLGTNTAAVSALQLLTAFNQLVTAGGTAPPHLLKALWPSGTKPVAVDYEKRPPAVSTAATTAVLAVLQAAGARKGEMVESLFDKRLLGPAAGTGSADLSCRRQDVLLGISRGKKPLTFLLVLDGACIDPAQPSLLRQTGRQVLKWLARPIPKAAWTPSPGANPSEKLYRQWRQVHHPAARHRNHAVRRSVDRMPDVRGQALRRALQELQPYGLPVEISGSGRVTGQVPKAGHSLTGVQRIRLTLQEH